MDKKVTIYLEKDYEDIYVVSKQNLTYSSWGISFIADDMKMDVPWHNVEMITEKIS